ncbi:MAG TPA: fimbria/pilus outer membrane usher protein [Dokdonella sp.]
MIAAIGAAASFAQAQTAATMHPNLTITPPSQAPALEADADQPLQLEVFINERATGLIAAFTLRAADGRLTSSRSELEEVGLKVPAALADDLAIPLDALPGVTYRYDEAAQTIRFSAEAAAMQPTVIHAQALASVPTPQRPPLGVVVNYALFGSADDGPGGPRFEGVTGDFETRVFGRFGLLENGFVGRLDDGSTPVRLESTYTYEAPDRLATFAAGDMISGGFSWTRPIRMGGVQFRRSFDLRPDLVTMPLPSLTGSAAAPSTLDLFIDEVRTLSAAVPQGPYEIDHPPIVYGSGEARIVLRDALGREVVSTTPFYASPQLLAPGLTDFSAELGFARRNYGTLSNDYDDHPAVSGSYRRGLDADLTVQAHAEGTNGLALAGGGATTTIGTFGLVSAAAAQSRAGGRGGWLYELAFESRLPYLSVLLRTQRTSDGYEDLASWTAAATPELPDARHLYGQPRDVDQFSVSLPLQRTGSSIGVSLVRTRNADDSRSRIANLSFTQSFGRLELFASAVRDFELDGSTAIYVGLSIPLGSRVTASTGVTHSEGDSVGYVEASRQGSHDPGSFGWTVRASAGDSHDAQAIARYSADFARFEVGAYDVEGERSATALMEGALSWIGGAVFATPRLDEAFALVDVGAHGVTVLRENRPVGVTGANGALLVPDLAAFVANRIAIDPAGLPVDAKVEATEAVATPYSHAAGRVDLRVATDRRAVLLTLTDAGGAALEIGSVVHVDGLEEEFVVGYDGEVYLEGLRSDDVAVTATTPDGASCRAAFRYSAAPGEQARAGPLACRPGR